MPKLGVKTFSNNTVLSGKQGEERLNYVTSISNYLLKNDVENLLDLVGPGNFQDPMWTQRCLNQLVSKRRGIFLIPYLLEWFQ